MYRAHCRAWTCVLLNASLSLSLSPSVVVDLELMAVGCWHWCVQADPSLIDKLAYYLWFAEYAYEAGTEPNLKKVLASRGKQSVHQVSAYDMMHGPHLSSSFGMHALQTLFMWSMPLTRHLQVQTGTHLVLALPVLMNAVGPGFYASIRCSYCDLQDTASKNAAKPLLSCVPTC